MCKTDAGGGVREEKPSSRVHFAIFGHAKHNRNYVLQGKEKNSAI
jgi:hypothetical protein